MKETAVGKKSSDAARRFRVRVVYTEPTYALSRGLPLREHQITYAVDVWLTAGVDPAADAEAAARDAFRSDVARESVGWPREIVRVECAEVASPAGPHGQEPSGTDDPVSR